MVFLNWNRQLSICKIFMRRNGGSLPSKIQSALKVCQAKESTHNWVEELWMRKPCCFDGVLLLQKGKGLWGAQGLSLPVAARKEEEEEETGLCYYDDFYVQIQFEYRNSITSIYIDLHLLNLMYLEERLQLLLIMKPNEPVIAVVKGYVANTSQSPSKSIVNAW